MLQRRPCPRFPNLARELVLLPRRARALGPGEHELREYAESVTRTQRRPMAIQNGACRVHGWTTAAR